MPTGSQLQQFQNAQQNETFEYAVEPLTPRLTVAQKTFQERCQVLRRALSDSDFLNNRGIGNDMGFYTFCYDPALELQARQFFEQLEKESQNGKLPCNIIHRNLYDILLEILEEEEILDLVPRQEQRRGTEELTKQIKRIASPQSFSCHLEYDPHQKGDVLLISGVGEVYPLLRVHVLLDNMQANFSDLPVVIAYPGVYTGQSFSLFGRLDDGNYYRAFDLL